MRRRRARNNPGSAGGMLLTLVGLGIAAFSGFELLTGGKGFTLPGGAPAGGAPRPAPPVLKPAAALPGAPAAPAPPGAPPAAAAPPKPPTAAQAQQAVQAAQAVASGASALFGGSTPSLPALPALPTFGDGSSPSAPVDADAPDGTGLSGYLGAKHGGGGPPVNLVAAGFDLTPCAVHGGYMAPACVIAYQGALTYLATTLGKPAWTPTLSGTLDAATTAAVTAFQGDNPPLKVDGKAGKATAAKIIALVTANVPTS